MPEISELNIIKISPERFLNACSPAELYDLDMLLGRKVYQDKINALMNPGTPATPELDFTRIAE